MANSKLLLASIAITLVIIGVRSDAPTESEIAEPEASELALRLEIEGLRSKISALESSIEDRINEVKTKEDSIARLNGLIQEKLSRITSLESEIESLRKKGAVDAKNLAAKADARVGELEKQIAKLRADIEAQSKKRDAVATRASEAEKKVQELNLRLETLQRTNEEQKLRIRKSQRALELAEGELMRAKLEATSKLEELTKVHGAWLPPWLATHISLIQDLAVTHAKPSLVIILNKASEKLEQVQKWVEPHFNTAKTEAKVFSKPYIDQVVIVTKPHVEKLQLVLMPYKKHVARAYRKSLRTARTYHRQVQDNIHEKLTKHELTKPYATKELAWFMASALLAFPIFFLYRVLAAVFCKKAKKPRRTAHASHTHRRPKRRHAEK